MVRRAASSRFVPEKQPVNAVTPTATTYANAATTIDDGASDMGSDIMTVSDIHTISPPTITTNDLYNQHQHSKYQSHTSSSLNQQNLDRYLRGISNGGNSNQQLYNNYNPSNNPADIAAGFGQYFSSQHADRQITGTPSDINTIEGNINNDNDDYDENASMVSDLQHTVNTFGAGTYGDDIQTIADDNNTAVGNQQYHIKNSINNNSSVVIVGVTDTTTAPAGADRSNDTKHSSRTNNDRDATDASVNSSFWSRSLKKTLATITNAVPNVTSSTTMKTKSASYDGDEFYDEGRPLSSSLNSNTKGAIVAKPASLNNYERTDSSAAGALPQTVIVTTRNDESIKDPNSQTQPDSTYHRNGGGGDSMSNATTMLPISVWKQRICGIRADRLIVMLIFVLLAAVGVIIGAIIVSQQHNTLNSSNRSSASLNNNENGSLNPPTPPPEGFIMLTRTPVVSPVIVEPPTTTATMVPTSVNNNMTSCDNSTDTTMMIDDEEVQFPVIVDIITNQIEYHDCLWLSTQPSDQINQYCQPNTAPYELCRMSCQNCEELPIASKLPWPIELCGDDDMDRYFDGGNIVGIVNCRWLAESPFDQNRLCTNSSSAYHICRETCRNCGPNITIVTNNPTESPTTFNSTFSDGPSAAPTTLTLTDTSSTPSISPSAVPIATPVATLTPTLVPVIATDTPVVAPTEAPIVTTDAPVPTESTLLSILLDASPSSTDSISRPDSAQALAYEWLQSQIDAGTYGPSITEERTVQIWSLATFAHSLGLDNVWLTGGPDDNDECLWDGVVCDATTRSVAGIDLAEKQLSGSIPQEITLLSNLIGLNLSTNNISGKIPRTFGSTFAQMEDLRLDRNDITGTIPSTVGDMSALRIWYIERNPQLSGTVPSSVEQLSNLEEFIFYYTDITGVIPQGICDLPNLIELRLDCVKTTFDGEPCWTRCLFLCGGDTGVPCTN